MDTNESSAANGTAGQGSMRLLAAELIERVLLFLMLAFFLARLAPSLDGEPYNVLLLLSEAFTVLLVLLRKPGAMAITGYAWAIAIVGTGAPLLAAPIGDRFAPIWFGTVLMAAGLGISLAAKIFLNRSFGIVAANRGVKRRGPYRLIRHPMYFGYLVTHVGFLLLHAWSWNLVIYATCWVALILRIRTEEEFLLQDEAYRSYAKAVPYRLIPGVY